MYDCVICYRPCLVLMVFGTVPSLQPNFIFTFVSLIFGDVKHIHVCFCMYMCLEPAYIALRKLGVCAGRT